MISIEELKVQIEKDIYDLDRISALPEGLTFEEKTILVQSRDETIKVLQRYLNLIEGKKVERSPKDKYYFLPKQHGQEEKTG